MNDRYERTKQLISYLDNLDVEAYLEQKPWQADYQGPESEATTEKKRYPIITEQLSMLVIDRSYDISTLSDRMGLPLTSAGQVSASDAMVMDQSGDLYQLQDQGRTLLFLSDMTMIGTLDWARLSQEALVMGFMRYEGSTMSYQLEYWDHGQCLLSRMESDGLRIQDEGTLIERYHGRGTVDIIQELFKEISGKNLSEIYEDDQVIRYQTQ